MPTYYYTDKLEDFGSSSIDSLHYDDQSHVLFVEFPNGTIIGYSGVPVNLWTQMKNASSKGQFYSRYIRGKFHGLGPSTNIAYDDLVKRQPSGLEAIGLTPQAFVVTGVVKFSTKVVATSMEQAIEKFKQDNPDSTVTEVTVSFV